MKIIVIPVLILLTLLLLGCPELPFQPPIPPLPGPDANTPSPDGNAPIPPSGGKYDCYAKTSDFCEDLTMQDLKDSCYANQANFRENPFFCDQILDVEKKTGMLFRIRRSKQCYSLW